MYNLINLVGENIYNDDKIVNLNNDEEIDFENCKNENRKYSALKFIEENVKKENTNPSRFYSDKDVKIIQPMEFESRRKKQTNIIETIDNALTVKNTFDINDYIHIESRRRKQGI
jgi:hypothetical protein